MAIDVYVGEAQANISVTTQNAAGVRADADALPNVFGVTLYLADGTAIAQAPGTVCVVTQKQDNQATPANITGSYNIAVDLTAFLDAGDAAYALQADEEIQVDIEATVNNQTVPTTQSLKINARPLLETQPIITAS